MFTYDNHWIYLSVQVYFSDLTYTHIESVPGYTWLALLCDVGGALGLMLGSAMLTLFELLDLVLMTVVHSFKGRQSQAQTMPINY